MKDIGCGTFKEFQELAPDRVEWRRVVASNKSQEYILDDDDDVDDD